MDDSYFCEYDKKKKKLQNLGRTLPYKHSAQFCISNKLIIKWFKETLFQTSFPKVSIFHLPKLSFVGRQHPLQYSIARKTKKEKKQKFNCKNYCRLSSLGTTAISRRFPFRGTFISNRSFPPLKKARWKKISREEVRGRSKNNSTERCGEEKSRCGHKYAGRREKTQETPSWRDNLPENGKRTTEKKSIIAICIQAFDEIAFTSHSKFPDVVKPFRSVPFRSNSAPFRSNSVPFRSNSVPFRSNSVPFRSNSSL